MELLKSRLKDKGHTHQWLADQLGISRAAVTQWHRIPAERVIAIEQATGIDRHDLRPDIYPEAT
ncbi:MAG: helix-turn-helix domain-containing protein [Proteobacteria bacterium]|nr:helix-turn-helix domain-containing protein [Pseudomonadota bacterium]